MSEPFKMKNSALKMSAKSGSPMQANYASPVKEEEEESGRTEGGNTTWKGKLTAAKDALGTRNFIQSYNQNKKDIRQGKYIGFSNEETKKNEEESKKNKEE